jgi:hypothetical protein
VTHATTTIPAGRTTARSQSQEISPLNQVLEYLSLRRQMFDQNRKTVRKHELPYLEAYLRELTTIEYFIRLVNSGDTTEVVRRRAIIERLLERQPSHL